ncbi:unnamed protein product [Boreogadus saida]
MPTTSDQDAKVEPRAAMSKTPEKRSKTPEKRSKTPEKRRAEEEEEEEELLPVAVGSLALEGSSDSEESLFSGLEESGSDSEEDDEDEEEEGVPGSAVDPDGGNSQETAEEGEERGMTEKERALLKDKTDEYDHDSSDEEDIRNTVGNIPMEWYKDFPHIGYDLDGKKILKPIRNKDELDDFLDKMENPDYWRTVPDKQTGCEIVLTDDQVDLVHRLQRGQFGDVNFNQYQPMVEFFSGEVMIHPVTNRPEDKRSFIPSLIEKAKVSKLVHAIKMGWIRPRRSKEERAEEAGRYYDLWASEDPNAILGRHKMHVPAPKLRLPGHEESYNPPPEYLLSEEERLAWEQLDPEDRKTTYLPRKFSCLRAVPSYSRFIHERFERCLDLYLCPRQRKMRVNVNPEDLIPKLPKPKDLQPFPTTQSLVYRGHTGLIRSISVSPTGQWLLSGSDDGTVRFWEVVSSRCLKTVQVGGAVRSVAWNPNPAVCLVAVAVGCDVLLLCPSLGDRLLIGSTEQLLSSYQPPEEKGEELVVWTTTEGEEHSQGVRLRLTHPKAVQQVVWHCKGDYLSSVMPQPSSHLQVLVHQVSRRRSQNPFRRSKGLVQCVSFHPLRPYFFVATQRSVRVYNLIKQEMTKKLQANSKWISSMAVHPAGDNVICGSYDCRLAWFDLDLSTKPYKMLRHHKKAVRACGLAHPHHTRCSPPLRSTAPSSSVTGPCTTTCSRTLSSSP